MKQQGDQTTMGYSSIIERMPPLSRLKDLRLRAALSQADLGKKAGVARTTILRLEQGEPAPIPSTVRKLAKALGVKPAELLDDQA
jgi:transcriptional regulator with XRE-family HTH domain